MCCRARRRGREARKQLEPRGEVGQLPPSPCSCQRPFPPPRWGAKPHRTHGRCRCQDPGKFHCSCKRAQACDAGGENFPSSLERGTGWSGDPAVQHRGRVPMWDSQPGWTAEDSAQPCHGRAERPRWSKKPFSCLASAFDAPVQLVATGDPRTEPWPGRQQGQGQDKPIPGAEPLAAAGGRRRGLSPSFNSCPRWLRGSLGALPVCARCWGQRGGSVAVPDAGLLLGEGLQVPSAAAGPHGRYCSMTDAAVSKNPEKKKGRKKEPLPRKPGGSHLLCPVLTKPGSPSAPDWGGPGDKRTGWKPRAVISPESLQPPTAVSAPF